MDIKRLNYFKGQFLHEQDFKDEQQYHVDMLKYHNQGLHTWGIASGLDVTFTPGEKKVTIQKGIAFNTEGRQIILSDSEEKDLSASPGNSVYLTISHDEKSGDPKDETGVKGDTRITEKPEIVIMNAQPQDPSKQLILAKVTLNNDKTIQKVDFSERKYAGVVAGDLEAKSMAFSLGIASDKWPKIEGKIVDAQGIMQVNSPKTNFSGALAVNENVSIGTTTPGQKLTVSGSDATPHGFGASIGIENKAAGGRKWYLRSGATGNATPAGGFSIADDVGYRLLIDSSGNVGIGAINPENSENWSRVLDILGSGHAKLSVRTATIDARILAHDTGFWGAPAGMIAGTKTAHPLSLGTNAAVRLTVDSSGNVGLGTTTPTQKLTVSGSDATSHGFGASIGIENKAAGGKKWYFRSGATGTATPAGGFSIADDVGYRLVIDNSGNTGIGIQIPRTKLDVNGFIRSLGLSVNDESNTGVGRGLWLWGPTDANHVIYSANPSGRSPADKSPTAGYFDTGHRLRLRTAIAQGFLFENSNEVALVDIDSNSGGLWTKGGIHAGNSDIYFTKIDHNHTGIGNKNGYAAIENAANYGALMILGRATGGSPDRIVKLWDYLEVNGNQKITGNIGINQYDPVKGLPPGWDGGVHTLDVYAEGSVACGTGGEIKIVINADGAALKPGGGSWGTISDERLKKNIKPMKNVLEKLLQLKGVTFEWKEPKKHGSLTGVQRGFVAQEVEKIFPEWVGSSFDGYKHVSIIGLEALLIEALRELNGRIEKLESKK